MEFNEHISDSAFLVNESRARKQEVSRDRFAEQWVPPERVAHVRQLWDDFNRAVYPFDDLVVSVRNRFFLDRLQAFVELHPDSVFVNAGAGFTSYPFLLDRPIRVLEVDFPHVTVLKKSRMRKLQKAGTLPDRHVEFFAADLIDAGDVQRLAKVLATAVQGRPSFFLLEGLTYYLDCESLDRLFRLFADVQTPGSLVALDYWIPDPQHPVHARLTQFFRSRFGYTGDFNLLDKAYLRTHSGFEVQELTHVLEQEAKYAGTSSLIADQTLFEHYAVLTRR